jgi:hypothetical protein
MLTALILVCSFAHTPDRSDCDMTSALYYDRAPDASALPMMCFKYGQEYAATEMRQLHDGEYYRIVCMHSMFRGRVG